LEAHGTIARHVPIIAVTANARLEQIESAVSAGIVSCFIHAETRSIQTDFAQDDVVSKPFRIPELIPKIEELVGKRNAAFREDLAPKAVSSSSL
jgi:CheY-like chemotaxis protein